MAPPIAPSFSDIARQRLESSLANQLCSLSFSTPTTTATDDQSLEFPRAVAESLGKTTEQNSLPGSSFASTTGHHASAITLGAGVFARDRDRGGDQQSSLAGEFDPERSLGRLVNELGKVMGDTKMPERPNSPFSPTRSPTPVGNNPLNMSFILARNTPLPSPPLSEDGNHNQPTPRPKSGRDTQYKDINAGNDLRTPAPDKTKTTKKDRLNSLRSRTETQTGRNAKTEGDITNLTNLLRTPARAMEYAHLGPDETVGPSCGIHIPDTLNALHERLKELERENSAARRRVRELEGELEKVRRLQSGVESGVRNEEGEALEDLVTSSREHLARLTLEVEHLGQIITKMQTRQISHPPSSHPDGVIPPSQRSSSYPSQIDSLRNEIACLSTQITKLSSIVDQSLSTTRNSAQQRNEKSSYAEKKNVNEKTEKEREVVMKLVRKALSDEKFTLDKYHRQANYTSVEDTPKPSKLRQGLQTSAATIDSLAPPSAQKPASAPTSTQRHRYTLSENMTYSPTPTMRNPSSRATSGASNGHVKSAGLPKEGRMYYAEGGGLLGKGRTVESEGKEQDGRGQKSSSGQSKIERVLSELEEDFARYKRNYTTLSNQYKSLDPASDPSKRHALAQRLKEVIRGLERKSDQIRDLRGLL